MKGPFRNKQGSSLLEVVIAIAVLGLMVAPVCSSLVLSHRLNAESERLLQARLLAEATVEQLMGEGIEYTTDAEGEKVLMNNLPDGVSVTTDFEPERIIEEKKDSQTQEIITPREEIELWYNVTVKVDDIEIKTIVKAAPVYVDEAIVEGGESS